VRRSFFHSFHPSHVCRLQDARPKKVGQYTKSMSWPSMKNLEVNLVSCRLFPLTVAISGTPMCPFDCNCCGYLVDCKRASTLTRNRFLIPCNSFVFFNVRVCCLSQALSKPSSSVCLYDLLGQCVAKSNVPIKLWIVCIRALRILEGLMPRRDTFML